MMVKVDPLTEGSNSVPSQFDELCLEKVPNILALSEFAQRHIWFTTKLSNKSQKLNAWFREKFLVPESINRAGYCELS